MILPWYFLKTHSSFLKESHALCDHILIGGSVNIQGAGLGGCNQYRRCMIHSWIPVRWKKCFCSHCPDQLMFRLREARQMSCHSVMITHC